MSYQGECLAMDLIVPVSILPINDYLNMAERELSAFLRAVETLFGLDQAKLAAEDWLEAAEQVPGSNQPTNHDWRAVTIAASSRLAHRLADSRRNADCLSATLQDEGIAATSLARPSHMIALLDGIGRQSQKSQ
jgi:hypothetical protein